MENVQYEYWISNIIEYLIPSLVLHCRGEYYDLFNQQSAEPRRVALFKHNLKVKRRLISKSVTSNINQKLPSIYWIYVSVNELTIYFSGVTTSVISYLLGGKIRYFTGKLWIPPAQIVFNCWSWCCFDSSHIAISIWPFVYLSIFSGSLTLSLSLFFSLSLHLHLSLSLSLSFSLSSSFSSSLCVMIRQVSG